MTTDTTNKIALMFGGFSSSIGNSNQELNDLWFTDGSTWMKWNTSFGPIERTGASLAYDETRQEAILFGGMHNYEYLGSTWKITPYTTDWIQLVPQTSLPPRAYASMAYDSARGNMVLFGGQTVLIGRDPNNLNDTWTWDGKNWQQQLPATLPPTRSGSNMVYDRLHQNIVLFGGGSVAAEYNDTWIWDGTDWVEQYPLHSPSNRANFGMAYDEDRQQVILFGGDVPVGEPETWAWNGQDWTQLQTFITPSAAMAYGAQLVYLPGLHSVVLFNDYFQKPCPNNECTFSDESQMWALTYQYLNYFPMVNK